MQLHSSSGHGVAEVLGRLCDLAALRQPDDGLLVRFLPLYYSELPEGEVDDRKLEDVYAVAVAHLSLARVRAPGQTLAKVLSPDRDRDGWHSPHSVLLVVTDDMPFLVDTMRMVLERHGLGVHLLVHPMLVVERDSSNRLTDVAPFGAEGLVEAWTQFEIDRTDEATAKLVEADILQAVDDVRRAVEDFPAMRDRMQALGAVDPILPWLAEGQFVFLGAVDYDRRTGCRPAVARGERARPGPRQPAASRRRRRCRRTVPSSSPARAIRHGCSATIVRRSSPCVRTSNPSHVSSGCWPRTPIGSVSSTSLGSGRSCGGSSTSPKRGCTPMPAGATRNVLENLPRDLVLEQDASALAQLVDDIVGLQERQLVRVFEVPESVGPWVTVLCYVPRSRFTADLPERIADVVAEAYGSSERTFEVFLAASSLARITVSVRRPDHDTTADPGVLERVIDDLSTSWEDRLREALVADIGEAQGREQFERIGAHAPPAYRAAVLPGRATGDVRRIAALLEGGDHMTTAVGHDIDAPDREWRFRIYRRGEPASLSELLPLLDHLGLEALDEQSHTFRSGDEVVYLYDIGVRVPAGVELDSRRWSDLRRAFTALVLGDVEGDGFNRLVLAAGLTAREVAIVRAYGKYLRQIGFSFSQPYVEATLRSHPRVVADLIALFHARFDPARPDGEERDRAEAEIRERVCAALDAIPSLDDDRICRMFLTLIDATVRTNYYRNRLAISFKFDPAAIPELPLPRPRFEIWVCGPRVEGVHLRGGPIARGGLRWSDRREDFRTEILGLMKAQMVKNAVIVPTGAKGGFVVKRPPADLEGLRDEVVQCYRAFISSLLDLTDNLVDGDRCPPAGHCRPRR